MPERFIISQPLKTLKKIPETQYPFRFPHTFPFLIKESIKAELRSKTHFRYFYLLCYLKSHVSITSRKAAWNLEPAQVKLKQVLFLACR